MRLMIFAFLFFAGCATQPVDDRIRRMNEFSEMINVERAAGTLGYADTQQRKWNYHRQLWPQYPYRDEFFSYTVMLGEKVDRGDMQASEYTYLATRKQSEIDQRMRNNESQDIQDAAAIMNATPKTRTTNCYNDGAGNTRCTTQ